MLPRRAALRLFSLLALASPALVSAQTPAGPEFRLNAYTTRNQLFPRAATGPGGDFIVSWSSYQDGSAGSIVARRFDAAGAPRGAELQVNTYTTSYQFLSDTGIDAAGRFVVVWNSDRQDGATYGVFGQRFAPSGARLGGEFQVNTTTLGYQAGSALATFPSGAFVVVWHGQGPGDTFGIFGQRFDVSGARRGAEFLVNTFTTGNQVLPVAAATSANGFVVVWEGPGPAGSQAEIFAQRFDDAGPVGAEIHVNTYTTLLQFGPAVASVPSGGFVVAWQSDGQDGSQLGVFARRFDAAGAPIGGEFRPTTATLGNQVSPSVAADARGDFLIAWSGADATAYDVFGQRYDAQGARRGAEFRVNTYTSNRQFSPSVSMSGPGNFVVAWASDLQDGAAYGVYAQRFGGLAPAALAVDGADNAVWEPGETAEVKPSWLNVSGAAQTFGGLLSGITGPAGATYGIADGSAAYGLVANGATAACTDCYVVQVNDPASRPVLHWDASAQETITPDTQGQVKAWTLHIGRSFGDVPRANSYYRFIETLLHNGVTGGCTAATYCPATDTTRDQMAVFVLVAKEGAGYAPPACTTPVFDDVPATNPFCRWIEELARRGAVNGCGGGDYCPGSPVTREQMAIFTLRTLDPALDPPACGTPMFSDVPASSPFCRWIEELARRQVISGCGGGRYCPADPVTREQMGVFIGLTFGLTLYGP